MTFCNGPLPFISGKWRKQTVALFSSCFARGTILISWTYFPLPPSYNSPAISSFPSLPFTSYQPNSVSYLPHSDVKYFPLWSCHDAWDCMFSFQVGNSSSVFVMYIQLFPFCGFYSIIVTFYMLNVASVWNVDVMYIDIFLGYYEKYQVPLIGTTGSLTIVMWAKSAKRFGNIEIVEVLLKVVQFKKRCFLRRHHNEPASSTIHFIPNGNKKFIPSLLTRIMVVVNFFSWNSLRSIPFHSIKRDGVILLSLLFHLGWIPTCR